MTEPRVHLNAIQSSSREVLSPFEDGSIIWREWGTDNTARPPLVLLHGGSGAWNHWVRNIPSLAKHHRLLVADLPGCGDSDEPSRPYDAPSLAAIMSGAIDHILPGSVSFDLVSFSFGGVLSGLIAHKQAHRIRSLTLIGVPILGLAGTGPANDLVEIPSDMSEAEASPLYRRNLQKLMFGDPAAADDLALAIQVDNMAKARLRSRGIARSRVLADSLKGLPCTLTCIIGEKDATLDPDLETNRDYIAEILPEARFYVVPRAGHWVQFERAETVNTLLRELLVSEPKFG